MKIMNSNYNNIPNFQSKFVEMLKQPANLKKPLDKMTKGDCHRLISYINAINFRIGITQNEINELLAKEGAEFLNAIVIFFKEKLGFADNNLPQLILINGDLGGASAGYVVEQNIIYLSDNFEGISKAQLFGLLRHEYQHAIQNQDMLRTENLGEGAVELYSNRLFDRQKDILINFAKNYSIKELLAQGAIDKNGAILLSELSKAMQEGNEKVIEEVLNKFKQGIKVGLNNFRKNLIQEKGLIKADSKLAEKTRTYFEDFKNIDYYDENGQLDIGKHSFKLTESEAELSQIMAESEIRNLCFLRLQKDNLAELNKNKEFSESLDREFEKRIKE